MTPSSAFLSDASSSLRFACGAARRERWIYYADGRLALLRA